MDSGPTIAYWFHLRDHWASKDTLIRVAKQFNHIDIFEAVHRREISSTDGADLIMYQRMNSNKYVRLIQYALDLVRNL